MRTRNDPARWAVWTLAGLAVLVLLLRLQGALPVFMRAPLNPDVHSFISDARGMKIFYDCPRREPFHSLWLKAGLLFSSDDELVARLTTLVQTLLAALGLYMFGGRFFGRLTGLVALWLFCLNPVVRYYGVSGLRDPLYAAALLLFGLLLFAPPTAGRERRQAVLAGVAGALLILTRVYAYAVVGGAFLIYTLRERAWRPERLARVLRHLLWAGIGVAALTAPDLLFRPPSPVHGQTVNLFRNLELTGAPGSWQTDPPGSHFRYLFVDHTLPDVVVRVAANYARYAYQYLPFFMRGYEPLWLLLPAGILAAALGGRGFVVGLLVLSLAPVVFVLNLNQVPGAVGIENRFVYQAFPLALLLVLHGAFFAAERLLRVLSIRFPALRQTHARLAPLLLPPARGHAVQG